MTALSDGPLGREAIHVWTAADGAQVAFNDQDAIPRLHVARMSGLFGGPDADDVRAPRTARMGEIAYPSYPRGKSPVYSGQYRARTVTEIRQLRFQLARALGERSNEGAMWLKPVSPNGDPEEYWFYNARVTQWEDDGEDFILKRGARLPVRLGFQVGFRMSDPRFYWHLPASTSGNSSGASVAVTNLGTAPSDPTFSGTYAGTVQVTLENLSVLTSNGTARLRFNSMPAGAFVVNFATREATIDGEDAMPYFDSDFSQWWDELIPGVKPGANTLRVTGLSGWGASFSHACW